MKHVDIYFQTDDICYADNETQETSYLLNDVFMDLLFRFE